MRRSGFPIKIGYCLISNSGQIPLMALHFSFLISQCSWMILPHQCCCECVTLYTGSTQYMSAPLFPPLWGAPCPPSPPAPILLSSSLPAGSTLNRMSQALGNDKVHQLEQEILGTYQVCFTFQFQILHPLPSFCSFSQTFLHPLHSHRGANEQDLDSLQQSRTRTSVLLGPWQDYCVNRKTIGDRHPTYRFRVGRRNSVLCFKKA